LPTIKTNTFEISQIKSTDNQMSSSFSSNASTLVFYNANGTKGLLQSFVDILYDLDHTAQDWNISKLHVYNNRYCSIECTGHYTTANLGIVLPCQSCNFVTHAKCFRRRDLHASESLCVSCWPMSHLSPWDISLTPEHLRNVQETRLALYSADLNTWAPTMPKRQFLAYLRAKRDFSIVVPPEEGIMSRSVTSEDGY
jgi:hypothetical protein